MVSIPDWSKLGRLFDAPRENTPNPNRYLKQKEAEVVKQAEEHGYFLNVSRSYIEDNLLEEDEEPNKKKSVLDKYNVQKKDLGQIKMIKLVGAHLRTVGDIGMCNKLTICVLSNNYITKFEALISCTRLVKLDLHNNQISSLPGPGFWMCMRHLQLVHLHDNPIGKLENLHSLSGCPNLIGLTLYDTPLSLKKNYRHHVVNSIWTLKALDNYVISDEEIIEDADFGTNFSSLHHTFAIDLCPTLPEDSDYVEERTAMLDVIAEMNFILKHNSPVLIIQRYIRGLLARRTLDLLHSSDEGYEAAKSIQRKFRSWKGSSPPGDSMRKGNKVADSTELDYDTYLQNRRPGSQPVSEASLPAIQKSAVIHNEPQFDRTSFKSEHSERLPSTPRASATKELDGKKHIFINLAKLQMGTLQSLQDDAITMETILPTEVSYMSHRESKSRKDSRRPKKPKEEKKRKVIKSVKQFFGPVVESVPSPEPPLTDRSGDITAGEEEEIPLINFRLKGLKQKVQYVDPMTEMVLDKKDTGKELRAAEDEYHRNKQLEPKPVVEKKSSFSSDKKMFNRVQGTMGLSCLWAVQQAYKDREKAEKQAAKLEHTMSVKEQREAAKERIKLFQEEKKAKALKDREKDQKKVMEVLEKRELARLSYIDKSGEMRNKSSNFLRKRRAELTFMSDFNTQNTSVSNALLRHDRQARSEDKIQEKTENIKGMRETEKEQHDVVKKYLEHRQLMRQTETAMQRAALDTKMLQEANDRVMEAKGRVEHLKQRSATVEQFYPLPSVSTHSLPPLSTHGGSRIIVDDFHGIDRFHTDVHMKHGRVGRHHTSVV